MIGISEGPVIPVKQALVMAESSPARRGINMGIVQNFGAQLIGTLLAPIVLVAIAERVGWRMAFLVAGIPGLIIAAMIWLFLREPPVVGSPSDDAAGVTRPSFWRLLCNRNVALCVLIATASVAWFMIMLTFLPLYLVNEGGFSPSIMSVVMSVIGLAGVTSAIIVPYLSDRLGRRVVIISFSAVGALAPFGALLSGSNGLLIGASLLAGCQMLGIFPLIMATVPQESTTPQDRAAVTSLVIAMAQIGGGALGPVAAGWLASLGGDGAALALSGCFAAISLLLAPFLRETRTSEFR
jgi:predicted MFS family arabinose efflux permease